MKNFTNNFKQFTSRLSARWLIMALMMLVGTSSAWGVTFSGNEVLYLTPCDNWINNAKNNGNGKPGRYAAYFFGNGEKWISMTAVAGETELYTVTAPANYTQVIFCSMNPTTDGLSWDDKWSQTDDLTYDGTNNHYTVKKGTWDKGGGTWSVYTPPCTKSVSDGSGRYSNGEITLSAKFNTCGSAYIGFQWKEKGNVWCYEDKNTNPCFIPLGEQSKENETATKTVSKSGGTYVFRPYIVDGSDATKWIYGDEFEVITCSDPSAGYSISNENASVDWDGTEKEVIITTVNGYATPSKIYYEGNETKPTAVGEYTITIDVPSNGTYCAATDLEIGTFEILCATATSANFTISNTTFTYNEKKQTPTIIPGTGVGAATTTYKQGDTTVESPTNAGTYDIYVTTEAGTGYCAITDPMKIGDFTIDRKDVSKEDYTMSPVEFTYNGEKQVPIINPESGVGIVRSTEYKLNNTTVVENPTDAGTYTVYITSDAGTNYTAASSLELGTFTIAKKAPSKTDFSYVAEKDYTGSALSAKVEWIQNTGSGNIYTYYKVNGAADNTYTTTEPTAAGTYIVAVTTDADVNYAAATTKIELGEFVINCPSIAAPDITTSATICEGTQVTLSAYNNSNTVKWYSNSACTEEVTEQITPTNNEVYYAKAYHEASGCYSSEYSILTFTVNPLPTITSISASNDKPVTFEDVVLTATGVTQGAEVKWYLGNNVTPVATGTTYIVTSETAGDVIVKAKAFLNGCESDFKEHKVTFDEENCQGNLSNDIIINFTHPDKDETNKNCQYWGFGKLDYKINGTSQSIDLGKETTGTKTITIENIVASKITDVKFTAHYKFNSCNCEAYTTTIELEKGYEYDVTIEEGDGSGQQSSGSAEKTLVIERSVSLSTQPPLSAPAVKTVSATSVEGSGVVNFVGKVIKTGCAAATKIYVGYQYKLATEPWPNNVTAGDAKGNLIVVPDADGKTLYETYSTTISGLTDGNYVFRAYIINGYNFTNGNYNQGVYYGLDIPVKVSTKKYPIENLQIKYANDKGDVLQDQNVTYCVRDNAYIKLIYDGSRLKPEEDEINISSTLENTFTLVEGIADLYTFVVKGNETITVNAKNKENTDNPTAELTINTYAVPVIPSIDIDKTTICSDDQKGAKITVSNPQVDITYQVYKILGESEPITHGAAKTYSEGVLEFNSMTDAGTYYVRAYNEQCPNAIAQSLDEILTVIDADATSISISPETKTVNPWVPVTFTVTKQGNYDYTFSCKEDGNDVTSNMVINKSGDTYVVKFPKPDGVSAATDLNGQVTFANKTYKVKVKLNADVQCGTFDDESEVTLEPVNEICK